MDVYEQYCNLFPQEAKLHYISECIDDAGCALLPNTVCDVANGICGKLFVLLILCHFVFKLSLTNDFFQY